MHRPLKILLSLVSAYGFMVALGAPISAWGLELKIASVAATSSGVNSFIRKLTQDVGPESQNPNRKIFGGRTKLLQADAVVERRSLPRPIALSVGFAPELAPGRAVFLRSELDFRASTIRTSDSDGRLELIVRKKSDSAGAVFLHYDLDFR